jgi:hypothetical protein
MLYNKKGGDKDEKTNIWDLAMCHTSLYPCGVCEWSRKAQDLFNYHGSDGSALGDS